MTVPEGLKRIDELRTRLLLRQEIDRRLDELLRESGRRVCLLRGGTMRENQIRNVLNVAVATSSVEVVTNFIRYQIGRRDEGKPWRHNDFGQKVIEDIEKGVVPRLTREVADEVGRKLQEYREVREAERKELEREARLLLVRLYLGYLNRWFYYADHTNRWDDIRAATEGASSDV